jgi:hypothetical protein
MPVLVTRGERPRAGGLARADPGLARDQSRRGGRRARFNRDSVAAVWDVLLHLVAQAERASVERGDAALRRVRAVAAQGRGQVDRTHQQTATAGRRVRPDGDVAVVVRRGGGRVGDGRFGGARSVTESFAAQAPSASAAAVSKRSGIRVFVLADTRASLG